MLYLLLMVASIIIAVVLLIGVSFWVKRDMIRGILYTALAIFFFFNITVIGVIDGVSTVMDEKAKEYGADAIFEERK